MAVNRRGRRALTLIEVMVVLFLITLVISVLTYSMRGSMDKGRAFKTEQRKRQISQMLMMSDADLGSGDVTPQVADALRRTGLVSKPADFLLDGWGNPMSVEYTDGRYKVTSAKYAEYMRKQYGPTWQEPEEE